MEPGNVGAFFEKANANVANRRPERNAIAQAQRNALVLPRLLEEARARGELNETLGARPNLAAALRNPANTSNVILQNLRTRANTLPRYATRRNSEAAIRARSAPFETAVANVNRSEAVRLADYDAAQARFLELQTMREAAQQTRASLSASAEKAKNPKVLEKLRARRDKLVTEVADAREKITLAVAGIATAQAQYEAATAKVMAERSSGGVEKATAAARAKADKEREKAREKDTKARQVYNEKVAELATAEADLAGHTGSNAQVRFQEADRSAKQLREEEDRQKLVVKDAKIRLNSLAGNRKTARKRLNAVQRKIQTHLNVVPLLGRTLTSSAAGILPWRKEEERRAIAIEKDKLDIQECKKRPVGWPQELHDPRNGEFIASCEFNDLMDAYTKSQKPINLTLVGTEYGVDSDTTMYDFIIKLFLNPLISLDEMVSFRFVGNRWPGCDSYESLARLFVFLGGIPDIIPQDGGNYKFIERIDLQKSKTASYDIYHTNKDALTKIDCLATGESGISDITLIHNTMVPGSTSNEVPINGNKVYLMSVKWKTKEGATKLYDITGLDSYAGRIPGVDKRHVSILLFLKNRGFFTNKCMRSTTEREEEELCEQVYGWVEDVKPFLTKIRNELFRLSDERNMTPLDLFNQIYNIQ